jgi:hypothetical protein
VRNVEIMPISFRRANHTTTDQLFSIIYNNNNNNNNDDVEYYIVSIGYLDKSVNRLVIGTNV